jgi:hypothetical protein
MGLLHILLIGAIPMVLGLILAVASFHMWPWGFNFLGISVGLGLVGIGIVVVRVAFHDVVNLVKELLKPKDA